MYMYIECSTWGYELASFPCYQKIPKYTIEVVHAGISSLKINVKGGGKKTFITYGGSEQQKDQR